MLKAENEPGCKLDTHTFWANLQSNIASGRGAVLSWRHGWLDKVCATPAAVEHSGRASRPICERLYRNSGFGTSVSAHTSCTLTGYHKTPGPISGVFQVRIESPASP